MLGKYFHCTKLLLTDGIINKGFRFTEKSGVYFATDKQLCIIINKTLSRAERSR